MKRSDLTAYCFPSQELRARWTTPKPPALGAMDEASGKRGYGHFGQLTAPDLLLDHEIGAPVFVPPLPGAYIGPVMTMAWAVPPRGGQTTITTSGFASRPWS